MPLKAKGTAGPQRGGSFGDADTQQAWGRCRATWRKSPCLPPTDRGYLLFPCHSLPFPPRPQTRELWHLEVEGITGFLSSLLYAEEPWPRGLLIHLMSELPAVEPETWVDPSPELFSLQTE